MSIVHYFDQHNIRFVDHPEGKYAFGIVAVDMSMVLEGERDGSKIARSVDDDWKTLHNVETPGGTQPMVVIWEPGVYEILIKSRKPKAKPFKKWVFEEILPALRKNGYYFDAPKSFGEALLKYAQQVIKNEELEKEQKLLIAELKLVEEANEQLSEIADELFEYSSIIRIAKFNEMDETEFRWQRLKAGSKELNYEIKKAPCPRFGTKNLYAHDVWRYCYPEVRLPECSLMIVDQNNPELV